MKHFRVRVILLAASIAIALVAIGCGIYYALNKEPGWRTVEVTSDKVNCSGDFVLIYSFGSSGMSAAAEYKKVEAIYSDATEEAYRLFNTEASGSELNKVSSRPNETVTVDPVLYKALELLVESENRSIYLAPVYVEYRRVFGAEDELSAARFDPNLNTEERDHVNRLAAFANDPEMIGLELKGGNKVCLRVHQDYLAFAREYEITGFLDFGWMKNAFIIDHLAQELMDSGCTKGCISSYDGFTRDLDESGQSYSFNLFNRQGNDIYMPAAMDHTGPVSIVFLRNYPMGRSDRWHYYAYTDGAITTAMVDPADGLSRSSVNNLVGYSTGTGCAQILLELSPVFVADTFDDQLLQDLARQEIYCVWFREGELISTDPDISVRAVEESE